MQIEQFTQLYYIRAIMQIWYTMVQKYIGVNALFPFLFCVQLPLILQASCMFTSLAANKIIKKKKHT